MKKVFSLFLILALVGMPLVTSSVGCRGEVDGDGVEVETGRKR